MIDPTTTTESAAVLAGRKAAETRRQRLREEMGEEAFALWLAAHQPKPPTDRNEAARKAAETRRRRILEAAAEAGLPVSVITPEGTTTGTLTAEDVIVPDRPTVAVIVPDLIAVPAVADQGEAKPTTAAQDRRTRGKKASA